MTFLVSLEGSYSRSTIRARGTVAFSGVVAIKPSRRIASRGLLGSFVSPAVSCSKTLSRDYRHNPHQTFGNIVGGVISPLLANVYLHYVFDLWANQWRRRHARGEAIIVRYADDFIVGFQHRHDAERFLEELRGRLRKFHLELHPEKTRLIEFGRFAIETRKRRGQGKPETFNFLGFTHKCGRTTNGKFLVLRHSGDTLLASHVAAT